MTLAEKIEQDKKMTPHIEKLKAYCLKKLRVVLLTDIMGVNVQFIGESHHLKNLP